MAVTSPASVSKLYTEFLAPAGTALTAFVRGGAYVPNVAANAGVPTAPPISLSQMVGAVRYTNIDITGTNIAAGIVVLPGGPPTAGVNSAPITLTITGGNPSPTISWARVSGDNSMTISPSASTVTSVRWSATVSSAATKVAVWRCTVSDGVSSDTHDVTITLEYDNE